MSKQEVKDFFEQYAIDTFSHENFGNVSFSDMESDSIQDRSFSVKYPFMFLGSKFDQLERPNESYVFGGGNIPDKHTFAINVTIIEQQENLKDPKSFVDTVAKLDDHIQKLIYLVFDKRSKGECCTFENMQDEVKIYGPGIIGARKGVNKTINFNFECYN
jgi:hypothetical protein